MKSNKIMKYNDFKNLLNSTLFEDSYKDLFRKIAESPDRYIGIFRPTKPKTKLIQNITQSHEIRFGDALENIFGKYFELINLIRHDRKIKYKNKDYDIDQIFSYKKVLIMIEQKVRDDHDSTKKQGQFQNFENKYTALSEQYTEYEIIPIMWFIDDSLKKNKKYYKEQMSKMAIDYGCNPILCYGEELFTKEHTKIDFIDSRIWSEAIEYLGKWKDTLPDMPEVNFDLSCNEALSEIITLEPSIFRSIIENEEIKKEILPIISPQNLLIQKLCLEFEKKYKQTNKQIYYSLFMKYSNFLKNCSSLHYISENNFGILKIAEGYN